MELLAKNPDVQERLRQELCEKAESRDLSYNELNALPLLDAVCRETLRLYESSHSPTYRCTYER